MNKPAAKEPSMDEILSSIRQIIADDDTSSSAEKPKAAEPGATAPEADIAALDEMSFDLPEEAESEDDGDAMPLSSEQIVADEDDNEDIAAEFDIPDISDLEEAAATGSDDDEDIAPVVADDITFDEVAELEAEPVADPDPVNVSDAAPMPDADLSSDIADELLQPATEAAVKSAFSKLGTMPVGADGLTIEAMLREMLKPMLKEWLDENLPATVERLVEKEIERLSRGR